MLTAAELKEIEELEASEEVQLGKALKQAERKYDAERQKLYNLRWLAKKGAAYKAQHKEGGDDK